jgi:hypothetical protein
MIGRVRSLTTVSFLCAVTALSAAQQALTQREADSMDQKLAAIVQRGEVAKASKGASGAPVRTTFTDRELNAYLKYTAKDQLPKGLVDPQVTMTGDRHVSGHATVDLNAVKGSKDRGWLDPAAYLSGSYELTLTGIFQTSSGTGTFKLESATIGGVPLPKSLLQEVVSYYSRSADLPAGIDLDKPFELPANIREVEIQRGAATVIQ